MIKEGIVPVGKATRNAIEKNHIETVRTIVENGGNGNLAVYTALSEGHTKIVKDLFGLQDKLQTSGQSLAIEIKTDYKLSRNRTPLLIAVEENNLEAMEYLLERKANIDHEDVDGQTALVYAARQSNAKMVELLLSRGAAAKKGLALEWIKESKELSEKEKKDLINKLTTETF